MKRMIALVLTLCLMSGVLPLATDTTALAEAAIQVQSKAADALVESTALSFEAIAGEARARLDRESPRDDGEWQYILLPERGMAVITGHRDQGRAAVRIPAVLEGCDVVALLEGVFSGHDALLEVTVTGNVYYAASSAFPRGVTLCGYHGSYAQKWAEENKYAFRNLSEWDFQPGVVDMADVSTAHFTRHSENLVTLRALEAHRLQPGSLFFLLDPANMYAISYYKVVSVAPRADGFVDVHCDTPEVPMVLNSFELVDEPAVIDWDTVVPAEGVQVLVTQSRDSSSGSISKGFHAKPEFKLKNGVELSFDVGYDNTASVSATFSSFDVDTFSITTTQTYTVAGKIETSKKADDIKYEGKSPEELLQVMKKAAKGDKWAAKTERADQGLGSVKLFTLAGVLNFTLNIEFNAEFAGSLEATGKFVTETTYTYNGSTNKVISTSKNKKTPSLEVKATAEAKIGVTASLKMELGKLDIITLSAFAGMKMSASKSALLEVELDDSKSAEELFQEIINQQKSLAPINMIDCIDVQVNLVVEIKISASITKYAQLASAQVTVLDKGVLKAHYHACPFKYVRVGESVIPTPKTLKDIVHDADRCTLSDSVQLMVPELSKTTPMGAAPLYGKDHLEEAPNLVLRDAHARVIQWYKDEQLSWEIYNWTPTKLESGDRIYGKTETINIAQIVGYDGELLKKADGTDAEYIMSVGEILTADELKLADEKHVIELVEINSPADLSFVGDRIAREDFRLHMDGYDHTYLAIRDNDLTIKFFDSYNKELGELVTGHFITVPQGHPDIPAFPVRWDPKYAIANYAWYVWEGQLSKTAITFPFEADEKIGSTLELRMTYTGLERIFEILKDPSALGELTSTPSDAKVQSAKEYFIYWTHEDHVSIRGFNEKHTAEDENGNKYEWTEKPDALVIPAYIDGKPVTEIAANAFKGLETLRSVKVPATVTTIGSNAFADCPNLVHLDISACSSLTALPGGFARNAASLKGIAIPGSVASIGDEAFMGCVKLTAADINADIGARAFSGCTSLSSVKLRTRVSSIGSRAFYNCSALKTLTVPCSAKQVGDSFIEGCTSLTTLTFDGAPATITRNIMRIGEGTSLKTLNLELGVTEIGNNAFSDHPNLTTIKLPEALVSVGDGALTGTAVEKLTVYDLGMLGSGFARNCETLKELTFEMGVINDYAFKNCTHLEKITMGDSVFAIGTEAFRGCSALTSVVIGEGVERIGSHAFASCAELQTVKLGSKTLEIGEGAFRDCPKMTSIDMGTALKTVGSSAFASCTSVQELLFPPTVESFGKDVIGNCQSLKKLTIGGPGMPHIEGSNSFGTTNNPPLETLILNEGVESVGARAFSNSYSYWQFKQLKHITFPSTLVEIGSEAFAGASALGNVSLPAGLKTINANAFSGCSSLMLNCPADLELESIGSGAFDACKSLTSINLGNSLKTVGDRAFASCAALEELHFPPSVESLGENVIGGCSGLKTLSIGGPNTPYLGRDVIGTITNGQMETIILNEGVESIGGQCFSGGYTYDRYKQLKHVTFPSTLVEIGNGAFEGASALQNVTLPAGLKKIGESAFDGCSSLTLNCSDELELESIGKRAFSNCTSLTRINLGHSLKTVGDYAFNSCSALEELHFPPSVESLGENVIGGCSGLKTLSIGGPNTPYLGRDVIGTITNGQMETIILNEGVESIGGQCFSGGYTYDRYKQLKHVTFPSTLVEIGNGAFEGASALQNVTLPAGLKKIGVCAFNGCSSLTLNCPDDLELEVIGNGAFGNCTSLTCINLGHSLKTVGDGAFGSCKVLEALHFPPSVESFGENVIGGCSGLKTLSIGGPNFPVINGREQLGRSNNPQLETLIINEGTETLGWGSFSGGYIYEEYDCLRNISLPTTLKTIEDRVFADASAITVLTLPSGIQTIADKAFAGCGALTTLHSPAYSEVIDAFAQAKGLTYTYDDGQVLLTLMDGEETLYSGETAIGASLEALLAAHVPADHDGTTFDGWCVNAECTAPWSPETMPSFGLTLYARMVPVHMAYFTAQQGGVQVVAGTFSVGEGHVIPWPEEPEVKGWRFAGWFTDTALTQPLAAETVMGTEDVNVYGKLLPAAGSVYLPTTGGLMLARYVPASPEDTEVWLPTSVNGQPVVAIDPAAFADAAQVTSLHLPDNLKQIDPAVFETLPNLTRITTGPDNVRYKAVNGMLYTADMGALVSLPQRKPMVTLVLPATVHTIGEGACTGHAWLQNAALPQSVTKLEAKAFAGCTQLAAFSAYGLKSIGSNALPRISDMAVNGPVRTGVLRDYFLLEDGDMPVFSVNYNMYPMHLFLDGKEVSILGLEAGAPLPEDFLYGEQSDGTVVYTWFTDNAMTTPWKRGEVMPAEELNLYTAKTPVYEYETVTLTVDGEEVTGVRLTAYNGQGGALVLPESIGNQPVLAIGESFLSGAHGKVSSVQIGSGVIEIADTALDAPEEYPFGNVVRADEGSYAAQWAVENGYECSSSVYLLTFEVNGGGSIAERTVSGGTAVKLPVPVKTGCTFLGWFTDEKLTIATELTDGCFIVPAADTVLYAAWEGTATVWPFTFEENEEGIVITGYTGDQAELTIPDSINGRPVTEIASSAFADAKLSSITLPETMETIGDSAFAGAALESVDLGGTKEVGNYAFSGCSELTNVTMKQTESLGEEAFGDCTGLEAIHLPAELDSVSASAFNGCSRLAAFTVEEGGALSAEDGVLYEGSKLLRYPPAKRGDTFAVPETVTALEAYAFSGNDALTSVSLAETEISSIPQQAFSDCSGLTDVVLGEKTQSIGPNAFANCASLTDIAIPAETTSIDEHAFLGVPASQLTITGTMGTEGWSHALSQGYAFVDPSLVQLTALTIQCPEELEQGSVTELTAALTPADAVLTSDLVWVSSNPEILYIFGNEAHALAGGEVLLQVTAPNGVSATLAVKVRQTAPSLSAGAATLAAGQKVQLDVIAPAEDGTPAYTWSSSDPAVAEVTDGVITALAEGRTTILCETADGLVLTTEITVEADFDTLSLLAVITTVEAEAFRNVDAERVCLGESIRSIGSLAFADNEALKQVILPASVAIAPDAFAGCPNLLVLCEADSQAHALAKALGLACAHPVE